MPGTGAPRPPTHYRLGAPALTARTVDNAGPKGSFADGAAPVHQDTDCCPAGRIPWHNASGPSQHRKTQPQVARTHMGPITGGAMYRAGPPGGGALLNLGRSACEDPSASREGHPRLIPRYTISPTRPAPTSKQPDRDRAGVRGSRGSREISPRRDSSEEAKPCRNLSPTFVHPLPFTLEY
jgi:hypothetical protein